MSTPAHYVRSIFTLGIAQLLSWIGAAVLAVMLPRYLGDVNLGKLAFALALTQLAGLVADVGTATYLTKEIARDPARSASLTMNALVLRIPLSLVAGALVLVVVNLGGYDSMARHIIYVLCFGIVLDALGKVVLGSLQGLHQMKALAAFSVVTKLGYAVLAATLLLWGAGPTGVAVAWVISLALGLMVSVVVLSRVVRLSARIDWRTSRFIFVSGLPFFVWQAALMIYAQIDAVMLSLLTHDAVVGWYVAAYRIVAIPMFVPTIIVTVLFPTLSAAASDPRSFNSIARRAIHMVTLVSVPMGVGIMLLPDKLTALFGYPADFANSIAPLVLLAASLPLIGIDMMIGTILNTSDRQRQWALTAVAAAVLNPLLNLVMIPYTQGAFGNGAIGAAAVTTLTEVFLMVVGMRLLPSGMYDRGMAVGGLKCVAAAALMGVAVWLARDLPLPVPVALGALTYGGACLALRAVSLSDLREARLHLTRRQASAGAAP